MPTKLKKITFSITPEMELCLDRIKKNKFYNCNQSEMIRTLIEAGLNSIQSEEAFDYDLSQLLKTAT